MNIFCFLFSSRACAQILVLMNGFKDMASDLEMFKQFDAKMDAACNCPQYCGEV